MATLHKLDKGLYNIKDGATFLGIKPFHMRNLCKAGKVEATKELIPNTSTERWVITQEALDHYKDNRKSFGRNLNGRRKCFIYLTPEELSTLQESMPEAMARIANPSKVQD